jgi:hypothetical protein
VIERLKAAWLRSDRLFGLLADEAWLQQPIALRQPFLFYLGHLPAFAWNHLGRGWLGQLPFRPDFDTLFERGIDPTGVDAYQPPAVWPERGASSITGTACARSSSGPSPTPASPAKARRSSPWWSSTS